MKLTEEEKIKEVIHRTVTKLVQKNIFSMDEYNEIFEFEVKEV